ncbi:MAG: hypothetical protein JEZ00_02770 [Anaerolineaceae bacterium]|nr:hypothetical protein [Anaerolineaceae bacterium]
MKKKLKLIVLFLWLPLILNACSLPTSTPASANQATQTPIVVIVEAEPTMDIVGTLVASTMIAFQQQSAEQTAAAPTATEEAAEPTPTETTTITATSTDVVSNLGTPTWKEDFNVAKSWYLDDDEYTNINITDGALVLTSLQAVTWHGWSLHYNKISNFYMESKIDLPTCNNADRYGMVFRSPDYVQGYFYGVNCSGQYSLTMFNGTKFVTIIPWTPNGNIHTGANAQNVLGVKAVGDQITLSVNGEEMQTVTHSDYSNGTFGAFIAAVNTPGFTMKMDNIAYWTLP